MPRLVRRRPLTERIKSLLNPLDLLLWLSEELNSNDWEQFQRDWGTPIGLGLNFILLIAKANTGSSSSSSRADDVFGDDGGGSGWLRWLATFVAHFLAFFSILNAFYTFFRKRNYRLFEAPIDKVPSTPSAHRVRITSSPASSSPLRFLSNIITPPTAASRAHPDATRDVWELAVWDPTPICLRLFCVFSPGHVLVYWLFLPVADHDPRPSTTVLTVIVLAALLSAQLLFLQSFFSQQSKDTALIHKEVLHEYDTKFVHPRLTPQVRDVRTQYSSTSTGTDASGISPPMTDPSQNSVDAYPATTIINRGFHTNPNPNYAWHVDPDGVGAGIGGPVNSSSSSSSSAFSRSFTSGQKMGGFTTPGRPNTPMRNYNNTAMRQPQFRPTTGDGGSLGVFSHAQSPLRKSTTSHHLAPSLDEGGGLSRSRSMHHGHRSRRETSPLKREASPFLMHDATGPSRRLAGEPGRRETGRF